MAASELTQRCWAIAESLGEPISEAQKVFQAICDEMLEVPIERHWAIAIAGYVGKWKKTKNPYYVDLAFMLLADLGGVPRVVARLDLVLPQEPLNFDSDIGRDIEACAYPSEISRVYWLMRPDGILRHPLLKPSKVEWSSLAIYNPAVVLHKGVTPFRKNARVIEILVWVDGGNIDQQHRVIPENRAVHWVVHHEMEVIGTAGGD